MAITLAEERPDTADARVLIAELDAHLESLYPSESRHGYAVEKLLAEGVAFFLVRDDGIPPFEPYTDDPRSLCYEKHIG